MSRKIPDNAAIHVAVIPATKRSIQNGGQFHERKYMRVAAYCRISTGDESQQTSYTKQKDFYTSLIREKQDWTLAGIYADEAISGTSRTRRAQFNQMITDALGGKIDYIITKSISRFARNTVDALDCIRQLRQQDPPVGVYFEKENIDTLDAKGELILTILTALAQEESRSISDNIRWTFQKNFREGKAQINLNRMLGYDKGEDGTWLINQEQALIVRHIFRRYLFGHSANQIAIELNGLGKTTVNGKRWRSDTVYNILRNEKYVGDLEMQKTITKDFLTHRSVPNNGEAPKYYVKNHHVGIIDRITWNRVQLMLQPENLQSPEPQFGDLQPPDSHLANPQSPEPQLRNPQHRDPLLEDPRLGQPQPEKSSDKEQQTTKKRKGFRISVFSNLICAACQGAFKRLTYTSTISEYSDERSLVSQGQDPKEFKETYSYAYPVWRCEKKYKSREKNNKLPDEEKAELQQNCPSEIIYEAALEQSFMEMLYRLKRDYQQNGQASELIEKYQCVYNETYLKLAPQDYSLQRRYELSTQIQKLEESYQKTAGMEVPETRPGAQTSVWQERKTESEAIYKSLKTDIRQKIEDLQAQKQKLEPGQGILETMKQNFERFLKCLLDLPETNYAGFPLQVNKLDTDGSVFANVTGELKKETREAHKQGKFPITPQIESKAPDYLKFEKGIYSAFISRGIVKGDEICFYTNFGVILATRGNSRKLASFLGFRKCQENGRQQVMRETYQVNGRKIQYRRKDRRV